MENKKKIMKIEKNTVTQFELFIRGMHFNTKFTRK